MAKKNWRDFAAKLRAEQRGVWVLVTRDTPDTALNPERLTYLMERALAEGLAAQIKPLTSTPGERRHGLWVMA
jgi:hypothetical protein